MSQRDFVIQNGVLTKYQGPGGAVDVPAGVTARLRAAPVSPASPSPTA